MVAAYVLIGTLAGMLAFIVGLLFNMSVWSAFMLYCGAGIVAALSVPATQFAAARLRGRASHQNRPEHRLNPDSTIRRGVVCPSVSEIGDPTNMKILAVDDEPSLLELIPMISAEAGFSDVTTVSSGPMALDRLEDARTVFDCFLLDISMPRMDGIELCARIRKIPRYSHTPIIMLTAMRDLEHLARAFKAGATEYATKPFDIAELGDRLREAHQDIVAGWQGAARVEATDEPGGIAPDLVGVGNDTNLPGFVEYGALEKYLASLTQKDLARTLVLAIKIDQFETVHRNTDYQTASKLLKKTAHAIGKVFKDGNLLGIYAGTGTYLIVINAERSLTQYVAEAEIEKVLKGANLENRDGEPLQISVSIGNPNRPAPKQNAARVKTTFEQAIASSEAREQEKLGLAKRSYGHSNGLS